MSPYSNPHAGHRQRMRDRFVREGLDSFEDHQILELVLFYAIPRGDTNEIGHRLIKHFGRLSAVFDARISDLKQVPGVGEQAAVLINALPPLMRRYHSDRMVRDAPILNSAATVSEYIKPLMAGRSREVFYVLCLDSRLRVKFAAQIAQGTVKDADHNLTKQLVNALGILDISVLDHVIIADDQSYSFAEMGVLPTRES